MELRKEGARGKHQRGIAPWMALAVASHVAALGWLDLKRPQAPYSPQSVEVEIWVDSPSTEGRPAANLEQQRQERASEPRNKNSAGSGRDEQLARMLPNVDALPADRGVRSTSETTAAEEAANAAGGGWEQIDPTRLRRLHNLPARTETPKGPRREVASGLDLGLAEFAKRVPHLSERPPPTLALYSDGSLRYTSKSVKAKIFPDGSVEITEPAAAWARLNFEELWARLLDSEKRREWMEQTYGGQIVDCNLEPAAPGCLKSVPIIEGGVDTCAWEPRDCYVYEKQWFMKETQKLREKLHQRWRQVNLRRSLHELESKTESIEADPQLTVAQKRAALRKLLADCADNWEGTEARAMIEGALRRIEGDYATVPDAGPM